MSPDVSEQAITVPGGRLHAARWRMPGDDRPPFVLLHDSLGSVAQWKDFPSMLARASGRTVIAYDRLGYGRSSARDELLDARLFDEEANHFFPAVLDAFDVAQCIPFGHSIGGPIAVCIAAMHPERCVGVVSMSGQAFVEDMTLEGVRRVHASFDDAEPFQRLAQYHGDKTRWVLDSWPAVWLAPAFRSWSLGPYLARVTCPLLAIHGDRDEYGSVAFPRYIRDHAANAAGIRVIHDCGHFPHRSHTRQVLDAVLALAAHAAGRP